jgi:hypothetical protein
MIALGPNQSLQGQTASASVVFYTVTGLVMNTATPPVAQSYDTPAQGYVPTSIGTIYTNAASVSALISSAYFPNTSGSVQTIELYINNVPIVPPTAIPNNGSLNYEDGSGFKLFPSGTTILQIASPDGSITVTNPTGPIVDIEGVSEGFVIAMATAL